MLNDNCHIELKNLRQIKYFKFRINSLQKYLMLRVSKIPIQARAQRERNACRKKKKVVTTIFHK